MIMDFLSLTSNSSLLPTWGIKIGWSETEFGIKSGGLLTVFGDVIYNTKDKTLRIEHPLYLLQEKAGLLSELKKKISSCTNWIIGLSIPLIISGTLFYYFMRKSLRQKR